MRSSVWSLRSAPTRGVSRSSRTWCGMRWTGWCRETSGAGADGEVVWSWRAHVRRQVVADSSKGARRRRWQTSNGSPGRSRISRNPPCREGRLSPPVPVVHALAQIFFAREPRVHAATRPSLRPLYFRRVMKMQSSGERRREDEHACLSSVIARSVSDEAIQSRTRGPGLLRGACHRAALRADPLARNDEVRCLKIE